MEYDAFFSYRHLDASEVMQIHEALQALGLNVWLDKNEICDFESITHSIVEGLAQSKVLLSYYSRNYWRSRACQWELTAAFLAAQREGNPIKRILIINPEEGAEHIHPVELRNQLFQKYKDAQSLEHLVSSVKNHIQGITNIIGDIHALEQPHWYVNQGVGSNRFVGRFSDMWKIHSALHASGVPIITGSSGFPVVQVQGMGGVGKSLLAEEYALRYAAAFPGGVFWLRAYGNDDEKASLKPEELDIERTTQIGIIATKYGVSIKGLSPDEIETQLSKDLERNGKPFLWVVDDFPSGRQGAEIKRWFAPISLGKTLITTRSKEYSAQGKLVPLGVFEPEEAWDLLTLWRKPEKDEEVDARMLIADLGYHALAIDVAGAALHESEGLKTFSEYREELASPTRDELDLAEGFTGVLPTDHETSIASTIFRSIKRLGAEGQDFLRIASILAVAPIPALLVSAIFSEVDDLDEKSGKDKAMVAFSQADRLSLTERAEDEPGARSVHVLITRTVRFKESQPERSEMLYAAAMRALITKTSIIKDGRIHRELNLYITHARVLVRHNDLLTATLMSWVARYDQLQGAYKSAETLLRRELEIEKQLLCEEHPDTLNTMNNLAETLSDQGDYAGARKLHEQVLDIRRKVLGEEHPSTLNTMNNLAKTLSDQGDYVGARKLQEQVLDISRKVLGEEHPDTLTTMNNLASTLDSLGDFAGARKLQEQVLDIRRKVLGEEHPSTLTTMNNLAKTLGDQGDYAGARKLYEQVLDISKKVLGEEHPSTLNTMNNLSGTLSDQGDYAGARILYEQVLDIRRKVLGEEHPYMLITMNNLAKMLGNQGDYAGARKLYEQVLDISKKVLGEEHPSTLNKMNNLASTLDSLGDFAGARKLQEQVLDISRKVLGEEHPSTLNTMNNLAKTLSDQGDYVGARILYEQVLDISRKMLGEEHPDTLITMNNLAGTLYYQGDYAGARKLQEQVLDISRKVLGEEHPYTLITMNNLAKMLGNQGDYAGARKLYEQVLDISKKVLGEAHPSTLNKMNNLASTLSDQGDYAGARKLYEQLLDIINKMFDEEQPATTLTAWSLFVTLSNIGDLDAAKDIMEKHLLWLVDRDPTNLVTAQREIRTMIIEIIG